MVKTAVNVNEFTLSVCFENEHQQLLAPSKMNLYAQATNRDTLSCWLI